MIIYNQNLSIVKRYLIVRFFVFHLKYNSFIFIIFFYFLLSKDFYSGQFISIINCFFFAFVYLTLVEHFHDNFIVLADDDVDGETIDYHFLLIFFVDWIEKEMVNSQWRNERKRKFSFKVWNEFISNEPFLWR